MNVATHCKRLVPTTLTLLSLLATGPAAVAAEMRDLESVTCGDVLLASGEERDGVILVLHAYLLGEKKQTVYDAYVLSAATDAFLDTCLESPSSEALSTLRAELSSDG